MIFKKFDSSRKGYLSQTELKKMLAYCQLTANTDEMVMSLSEFDPDLKGFFTYELCFQYLIEKYLSSTD